MERVAMVGENKWQKWINKLGVFFKETTVRYFDEANLADAERWVREP